MQSDCCCKNSSPEGNFLWQSEDLKTNPLWGGWRGRVGCFLWPSDSHWDRSLWDLGLYLILQPLNWWYSSLNVHLSSHRRSICVPNSTSLLQTNMLFSRWLPGKEPYRECAETWASFKLKVIHCWQWMQIAAAATKHLLLFFKRILHNLNKVLLFSTISTMHFFFVFLYKRPIRRYTLYYHRTLEVTGDKPRSSEDYAMKLKQQKEHVVTGIKIKHMRDTLSFTGCQP